MSELAQQLHCDNSNVTGIAERLEAAGLLRRVRATVRVKGPSRTSVARMGVWRSAQKAGGLEPVGDARDVRVVAVQLLCELAHGDALVSVLEVHQRVRLLRRQAELLRDADERAALSQKDLEQQLPGALLGRRHAGKLPDRDL